MLYDYCAGDSELIELSCPNILPEEHRSLAYYTTKSAITSQNKSQQTAGEHERNCESLKFTRVYSFNKRHSG